MESCNKSLEFDTNFQYYFTHIKHFINFYDFEFLNCQKYKLDLITKVDREFEEYGENKLCEKYCPTEFKSISYIITPTSNFMNTTDININYDDFFIL